MEKLAYETPVLVEVGSLEEVTQGNNGARADTNGNGGNNGVS